MVVLGLLLVLACAALAVDAVVQNHGSVHATAFNQGVHGLSLGELFVAGAVVGLLFALGVALFTGGLGRSVRKGRERRALRRESAQAESLREENARLSDELAQQRAYPSEPGATTGTTRTTAETTGGRHRL
jgi:uncharacterized protein HemX